MPDCGLNPLCWAEEGVGAAVGGAIEDLATAILEALSQIVTTLSTFWVDMPTSNLTTADGVSASPTVAFLQESLWYWTAALAVLAVIIGGIRLVWEQRGAPVRELVRSLLTLTLVSGMGLAVIAFLIVAADGFSAWIIDQATDGGGFANAIQQMMIFPNGSSIAVFMVIILGLIGICTSVIQIVLMIVRSGMLVILAGVLPTTAAFTNTEMGKQWFQKTVGWTLAFILYKPAAAIVYAVAFRLMETELGGGNNTLLNIITGMALMVVALIALPAMLRFVTPMVGAVAGGAGGGLAAGAVGAAATGAISMGSAGRGSGSASPVPASSGGGGQGAGQAGGAKSTGSPSGSAATGSSSGGAKPTPGSSSGGGGQSGGPSGAPAGGSPATAGGGASGGGAATGAAAGAKAGSVAGPAGTATGAAASAGAKAVKGGSQAVKQVSDEAAGEGPSGSSGQ